ncbi:hypothetical protein WDV06_08265 [Streptomyces racemochromogenes]|uniref:Uncharacterized protein n=1 Tax=Streptomyces racemochromogenes TaxID=67353 RepID=A0ABW7P9R1_9ACTN
MAQIHDLVLGQGPDAFVGPGRQDDVPGRILIAQSELAQDAEGRAYDAAPQEPGGNRGVRHVAVSAVALGVDEVIDETRLDIGDQERASNAGVQAEPPQQEAELVIGLMRHLVLCGHLLPDLENTVDAVCE